MSLILATVLLCRAHEPQVVRGPACDVAQACGADVQTGSLIFCQGDCLAVRVYTSSRFTHVGCVVVNAGEATVYDSMSGVGVRRMPLEQFLASQGEAEICVYSPNGAWSVAQQEQFAQHLESQLGRPYAITHHLTGRRGKGLHCAEYAGDALIACGRFTAANPSSISPANLMAAITASDDYRKVAAVQVERAVEQPPENASWCRRMWFDTKQSTQRCCAKLWGWICCK
ncbi:MAG: YiiX/YebB-like N1pC/P60 family cysteine hydrolase [Planctomycetaceae bacterium]